MSAVYWGVWSILCTAVSIISSVFYCRQHSLLTDGPTNGSWSKLLSERGTQVLRILAVFRPVGAAGTGTASTASTRSSTTILSMRPVYWEYEVYFDHLYLCTAVSTISCAFYRRQHWLFTDGPTNGSWSKLLSGGGHEYVAYWQYLESICCEHSK